MENSVFPYSIKIPAANQQESIQKMKGLAKLAGALDGRTIEALAKNLPNILADPNLNSMVRNYLGL